MCSPTREMSIKVLVDREQPNTILAVESSLQYLLGHVVYELVGKKLRIFHGPATDIEFLMKAIYSSQTIQSSITLYESTGQPKLMDFTCEPLFSSQQNKICCLISLDFPRPTCFSGDVQLVQSSSWSTGVNSRNVTSVTETSLSEMKDFYSSCRGEPGAHSVVTDPSAGSNLNQLWLSQQGMPSQSHDFNAMQAAPKQFYPPRTAESVPAPSSTDRHFASYIHAITCSEAAEHRPPPSGGSPARHALDAASSPHGRRDSADYRAALLREEPLRR